MLFNMHTLRGIATGEVTLAFRRWSNAAAVTGGSQRTPIGVVGFDSVELVAPDAIDDRDARAAGYADRAELFAELDKRAGTIFRIALSLRGDDPRIKLREQAELDDNGLKTLSARLDRMDARTADGAWTRVTLALIEANPGMRAAELAQRTGCETLAFKRDVRKLKELGLTESLEVGYRLSARGRAFITAGR